MAEIKSTLELVMERTRHLTLTEEEKRAQEMADLRKQISGLVQRVLDGGVGDRSLEKELEQLTAGKAESGRQMLWEELLRRLDLTADNTRLLSLLAKTGAAFVDRVQSVIEKFQAAAGQVSETNRQRLQQDLASRGIAGSAVIPNLNADSRWLQEMAGLRDHYGALLAETAAEVSSGAHLHRGPASSTG